MASIAPFGALAEAGGVAENLEEKVQDVAEKKHESPHLQRETTRGESLMDSSDDGEKVQRVKQLARALTQNSVKNAHGDPVNPFAGSDNPSLDPLSGKFSYRAWVKTLVGLQSRDPERYPQRVAGVAYRNLSAYGFGESTDYQKTFGNYPLEAGSLFRRIIGKRQQTKIQILRDFDGLVRSGEMLVVLGRPGSGCSTLLKTISGETHGYFVDENTSINYQGIPMKQMHNDFRGECIYQAEVDIHFPQLTVGQTLEFAAQARAPRNRIPGVTRDQYAAHMRDVIMAVFGLAHTLNTKVGNDFIRGVSGGERKRVSIAEAALGGSPLQCWDNSTRGLDSATALEFVKTLRLSTEMAGSAAVVAIYQASQSIYDVFDKVAVLYEGRQIYFGEIHAAKKFFVNMGFDCPLRQTTADFLTSLTSPAERIVRPGFEGKTPYTPDEFAAVWQKSDDRAQLLQEIADFDEQYPVGGEHLEQFKASRQAAQAKGQRVKSPYTLSIPMQIKLCTKRGFQRLRGDATLFFTSLFGQTALALIISSVFFNLQDTTADLYSKGALLFFAILMSAFQSALEILTLYAQRGIVEKHSKYAFYHPSAEAVASMITDLPNKIFTTLLFDLILYFMTNLRRTPGHFFVFLLFTFVCTLTMSMYFRSIAATSRSLSQAMAPAAIFILGLVIYTGFAIPTKQMHPWFRWINYLDPVGYAFEALMVNEFHSRQISCAQFIPGTLGGVLPQYSKLKSDQQVCATNGASPGSLYVDGDAYLDVTYQYYYSHLWRNLGIIIALMVFGCTIYLMSTEYISSKKSKGEVLLFRRGKVPEFAPKPDVESHVDGQEVRLARSKTIPDAPASIQKQTAIFHWDSRKTGYVQQQDLHLATSTVREALNFSAILRQPKDTPHAEKLAYVDEVIKVLEMETYADAVVGVPGEGLNVEQRKRLTIGVELAAKPALLLFLDEPTSGLDSQTAWSICALLRKLADNGQAILCTIHQPSAILFQEFDRLLFLAKGGKTVYFGEVGENSKVLTEYFERNGSRKFGEDENPAEVMLEVIGAAPGSETEIDWPAVWNGSKERAEVKATLAEMKATLSQLEHVQDHAALDYYAATFKVQLWTVLQRVFAQYWRTPSYLYSKVALSTLTSLFIGFSFWKASTSLQGLQDQLFAIFMLLTIFGNLTQQIMPHFVIQRSLYEVRERPSKTYSWQVFILSNLLVELPWNAMMEAGGNLANLMFSLTLIFNGVLASPSKFPHFWIFMYRVSPFTYLVSGVLSTGLANTDVVCADYEYLQFNPPQGMNCSTYLDPYKGLAGGYYRDGGALQNCTFCTFSKTNQFLDEINVNYDDRWRNFGLMWVYIAFNAAGAVFLYWLARVPKNKKEEKEKKE
ncbi:ABC transporter CDR4 [Lachnellula arida]|uniref:ABC transporter CDR4 n=1 Tax=Lachnellula arida TaxID=1316785 RepID=A0A8T9BKE8_9HELO|nr:ABC transporter CDR4 [Lachnellula arida]